MSALFPASALVSKGSFAELIGVSPGRVSQMISEGKIGPEALDGEGRSAKIRVDIARAQLRERTDLGQRLGNGISTRLDGPPITDLLQLAEKNGPDWSPTPEEGAGHRPSMALIEAIAAAKAAEADPVAERLKAIKLEEAERKNRQGLEDDLLRRGVYVRADQSRAAMMGVAVAMLNAFESGLSDIAGTMASQFNLPERELAHTLRLAFRELRVKAAAAARARAEAMADLVVDDGEEVASEPEA